MMLFKGGQEIIPDAARSLTATAARAAEVIAFILFKDEFGFEQKS